MAKCNKKRGKSKKQKQQQQQQQKQNTRKQQKQQQRQTAAKQSCKDKSARILEILFIYISLVPFRPQQQHRPSPSSHSQLSSHAPPSAASILCCSFSLLCLFVC